MCNHRHTKQYFKPLPNECQLAAYIEQKAAQVPMVFRDLPCDLEGLCVFHSRNLDWKRDNQCAERFLDLQRAMATDDALNELDFREFQLVGADFTARQDLLLENAFASDETIVMGSCRVGKPIRMRGAIFHSDFIISDLKCVDIDFDESVFKGVTTLIHSHFQDFTSFIGGTRFEQNLVVEDCVFEQLVSLDNAVLMEQLFMVEVDFKGGLSSLHTHQLAKDVICQLSAVRFGEYSSFNDAVFAAPVVFERCIFDGETHFEHTVFSDRLHIQDPNISDKIYFIGAEDRPKLFRNAVVFNLGDNCFEQHGQLIFKNANLYNANAEFKESLRALELEHRIDLGPGCLLYRNAIEILLDCNRVTAGIAEDLAHTFSRFFEANFLQSLKVDLLRDLKKGNLRIIFHSDEAIDPDELRRLLDLGKIQMLEFFKEPTSWPPFQEGKPAQVDFYFQIKAILERCMATDNKQLLNLFFNSVDDALRGLLQEHLQKIVYNINAQNVLIGNTLNADKITIGTVHNHGLSEEHARQLAAGEIINNLLQLETRFRLISYALGLEANDNFEQKFDREFKRIAPAISGNAGNNLSQLLSKTNASGLRHALNGHPLRKEIGQALAQAFVQSNMEQENYWLSLYLDQLADVEWAEEALLRDLAELGNSESEVFKQERIALDYATVLNRSKILNVYALRLLGALEPSPESLEDLKRLDTLRPREPLTIEAYNQYLLPLLDEMATLSAQRNRLVELAKQDLEDTFEKGIQSIELQTTLQPTDTWQEVLVKARILRSFGRHEDSAAALRYFGQHFAQQFPNAEHLATIGAVFALKLDEYGVKGGLYVAKMANMPDNYPLQVGDILLQLGDKPTMSYDDVLSVSLKTAPNIPIAAKILRWNGAQFQMTMALLPSKPSAAEFLPI
jgi:hypothetical protein